MPIRWPELIVHYWQQERCIAIHQFPVHQFNSQSCASWYTEVFTSQIAFTIALVHYIVQRCQFQCTNSLYRFWSHGYIVGRLYYCTFWPTIFNANCLIPNRIQVNTLIASVSLESIASSLPASILRLTFCSKRQYHTFVIRGHIRKAASIRRYTSQCTNTSVFFH